jgi:RimJ/RimL family protein N-acetyltransferase
VPGGRQTFKVMDKPPGSPLPNPSGVPMAPALRKIHGERIALRSLRAADAPRIAEFVAPYEVSSMLAVVPHPYTLQDAESFVARSMSGGGDMRNFAIDDGSGLIGIVGFNNAETRPELGYWLGRAHWGKGIMSEAARLALAWLFRSGKHAEVKSGAFADNPASLRIQENLGFRIVGRHEARCVARGRLVDHIDTRLARADFQGARP